ncbi:endonuclease G, mitochondrial [Drosophila tropicalis]|uniref:endonuclease G, mitochondrial n=1 Tax=Drosophila tropicalis TaxID=46794 RepID=UPI0035AC1CAE
MPLKSILTIFAVTAGSFFALGAYYQHQDVMRNIKRLEQRNPHAYFIRRKLYALLCLFSASPDMEQPDEDDEEEKHKFGGIMKYGFPSMNDITLNEEYDFVTAFDRRNSAIQWMCERIEHNSSNRNSDALAMSANASPAHFMGQSEASRVFFISNIKSFVGRGLNLSIWHRMLLYVVEMSQRHGTVYVYTGSIYMPSELKNNDWYLQFQPEDNAMVAVPTHFFKILVIDPKHGDQMTPYAEAYVIPNAPICDSVQLKSLLSDVRDIENATGLKFFEGLDRHFIDNQTAMETNQNSAQIVEL